MSRASLTQLEQTKIEQVYINPNYSYDVDDILKSNNTVISPPEINIMSINKDYPSIISKKNLYKTNENDDLTKYINRVFNDININKELYHGVGNENIKEMFINHKKKNEINYKNIEKQLYKY
tara:strand:+ start:640 stop:1005 length:366 start_codon:yes stop_codon:yes gene_type:complete